MMRPEQELLPPGSREGEDARRVRGPGWVTRNREALVRFRGVAASVTMVAPPPARIPLALACLAADGLLLAEKSRLDGRLDGRTALRAAALAVESGAVVASAGWAPKALARRAPQLVALRHVLEGLSKPRGGRI